jgi:hypothetical protein
MTADLREIRQKLGNEGAMREAARVILKELDQAQTVTVEKPR